jgi:hypothetical protein
MNKKCAFGFFSISECLAIVREKNMQHKKKL